MTEQPRHEVHDKLDALIQAAYAHADASNTSPAIPWPEDGALMAANQAVRDAFTAVLNHIASLEAELRAARRDTEIVEWTERNPNASIVRFERTSAWRGPGFRVNDAEYSGTYHYGDTFREAARVAMAAHGSRTRNLDDAASRLSGETAT